MSGKWREPRTENFNRGFNGWLDTVGGVHASNYDEIQRMYGSYDKMGYYCIPPC